MTLVSREMIILGWLAQTKSEKIRPDDYKRKFETLYAAIGAAPVLETGSLMFCKDCAHCVAKSEDGKITCGIKGEIVPNGRVQYGRAVDEICFCSYGETQDEMDRRDTAEQDAYEQLCNLGNPEDGSL